MPSGHQGPRRGIDMAVVSFIVAVAENGVIGKNGDLPWHLPADLKRFKKRTMGQPIVMGRKTHESIGRPLPGRPNWVLTRYTDKIHPDCQVFASIEALQQALDEAPEVMVIGGAELYKALLPMANYLYLTVVHAAPKGDAFFPGLHPSGWTVIEKNDFPSDDKNEFAQTELVLKRNEGTEATISHFQIPSEWLTNHES